MSEAWSIAALSEGEEPEWSRFVQAAESGTLFHDLSFLGYHPKGRFRFQHLMLRLDGKLAAVLPGGFIGADARRFSPRRRAPRSAVRPTIPNLARPVIGMVAALCDHAKCEGWTGINITLPPAIYRANASDTLSFALFAQGFHLAHRGLCQTIELKSGTKEQYAGLFRDTSANLVRAGRRKGIKTSEGGLELLDQFLALFADTYRRHGKPATHTPEEIADLLRRLPDRVRINLATLGNEPVAGVLVFVLNARVAYSFYICMSDAHAKLNGNVVLFAALIDRLAEQGYRWLDLGPSASDSHFNAGVTFFKEGLGAAGYCRDQWFWMSARQAQ